jgi:hypothetical protein
MKMTVEFSDDDIGKFKMFMLMDDAFSALGSIDRVVRDQLQLGDTDKHGDVLQSVREEIGVVLCRLD